MSGNAVECHLQLACVGGNVPGQELHHLKRRVGDAERPCFLPQDAEAELVIGRKDVDRKTACQTGLEPLIHPLEPGGRAVSGDHHLAAMVEQRIERVKKFLLRAVLVADELDVVDQQHVGGAQAAP